MEIEITRTVLMLQRALVELLEAITSDDKETAEKFVKSSWDIMSILLAASGEPNKFSGLVDEACAYTVDYDTITAGLPKEALTIHLTHAVSAAIACAATLSIPALNELSGSDVHISVPDELFNSLMEITFQMRMDIRETVLRSLE